MGMNENDDRDKLITKYNITRDDFNNLQLTNIDDALRLWTDSMAAALDAMRYYIDSPYFSDDDTDYMNAIADQIRYLTDARICDTNEETIALLNKVLNSTRDGQSEQGTTEYGFKLGYADHDSPLSTLAEMNQED